MSCIINKARLNLGRETKGTKKLVEFLSSLEGKVKGVNQLHF